MANTIIVKRSSVAGKVPLATDLQVGELAVNLADQKIYSKNSGGTVVELGGGAGSGDVVGPASSTDNAITRFDGTTGKLVQNSTATIDDNGNFGNVNAIAFDTTPATTPTAVGAMFWDSGDGTPSVILDADVTLQLGQENIVKVYNGSGATITNGSVVAVSGAQGQRPSVVLADADSEPLSAATLGIATEDIANGAEGFVTTFGLIRGINTSAFTAGAPIYLSSTAGAFTATRPAAPAHTVFLGWVIKVNASSGEVFVNISNGWELDELHNVLISSPVSGNTLVYDATAGVWKNASLTAGTGISVTNGAGSITIANTGVTSVTGTSPVSSSGGATPAISLASGYGDTQNPYASKTANTFLAAPNGTAGVPSFRAIVAADIPTLNQNTTGTASNVTGTVAIANGGSGATTAAAARTNFGATTIGSNLFTLTNPSAITFLRVNADNTVSALDAATFRTAIGAGTSSTTGTVTSVGGTGTVSGLTLSGTVTTSGNLTLGGTLSVTPSNFASQTANTVLAAPNGTAGTPTFRALVAADIPTLNQNTTGTASNVTGTVAVANGGTGQTSYTDGQLLIGNSTGNTLAKATLTQGTGISITNGAGSITITNSAPDQTVALTGSGATTVTGTYPNFTISSTNTTYSPATSTVAGLIELASDTVQSTAANAVTSTASRTYGLQVNASGQGVVNVPWTDTVYTLPAATSTALGGIELGSDTVQTTAANAVTSTASRTYALQVNASGQGVVNVPWTDTNSGGTVTSIATGTGLSGGPITTTGTISLANTTVTAGSYTNANITVDAQGRLTAASSGSSASGTVTSVGGTGTVAGITLSGTVTTSGNLTLGGTFALPSGQVPGKMVYDTFSATASQTTFTTSATYTSGKIEVFVNGVKVRNGSDVTVTSGTSVVMASGLPAGTLVDLVYPI